MMHLQLSKEGIKSSTTSPEGLHEDAQKNVTHLPKGPPKKAVFPFLNHQQVFLNRAKNLIIIRQSLIPVKPRV